MRNESCRSCGEILQELQACPDCKEGIQFTCSTCRKTGDIQVHPNCTMPSNVIAN